MCYFSINAVLILELPVIFNNNIVAASVDFVAVHSSKPMVMHTMSVTLGFV
jgi:hypothetical protein